MARSRVHTEIALACILSGLLIAVPTLTTLTGSTFYVTLLSRILVYAIAAVGLNIILGYAGLVSFGHALYMAQGAYVVGIMSSYGLYGGWQQLSVALAVGCSSSLLIGMVCLRASGMAFIMITLAFCQMFYFMAVSLKAFGGEEGFSVSSRSQFGWFDLSDSATLYYVILLTLALSVGLVWRISESRFGVTLRASRTNETRLATLGYAVLPYKLLAYVISALFCVLAGMLLVNLTRFISPSYAHWSISGDLIVMVVLGGTGTVLGPVLGAIAFGLLEQFLPLVGQTLPGAAGSFFDAHSKIILGVFIVSVTLVFQRGLFGLLQSSRGTAL